MNPGTAAGVDESHEQTVEYIQSGGGGGGKGRTAETVSL